MVKGSRYVPTTEQPTLWASFTKAGFNRDFTKTMFYAEVTCGGKTGREYVIMDKVPYAERYWYWYVVRVDHARLYHAVTLIVASRSYSFRSTCRTSSIA